LPRSRLLRSSREYGLSALGSRLRPLSLPNWRLFDQRRLRALRGSLLGCLFFRMLGFGRVGIEKLLLDPCLQFFQSHYGTPFTPAPRLR
jgi:hypothetical protein